jgi:hypothetical protein
MVDRVVRETLILLQDFTSAVRTNALAQLPVAQHLLANHTEAQFPFRDNARCSGR